MAKFAQGCHHLLRNIARELIQLDVPAALPQGRVRGSSSACYRLDPTVVRDIMLTSRESAGF